MYPNLWSFEIVCYALQWGNSKTTFSARWQVAGLDTRHYFFLCRVAASPASPRVSTTNADGSGIGAYAPVLSIRR